MLRLIEPISIQSLFYALMPMKLVEHADALIQHAHVLFENHEPMMNTNDRRWAEDQMT
jgi:hypothetical protein